MSAATPLAGLRVLAVASAGGHFIQLLRLRPAWEQQRVAYLTTHAGYRARVTPDRLFVVPDASRTSRLRLALQALRIFWVVARYRPHVVVSTGAAPGYFALRFGKIFGARTIWIDSIANVDKLSLSGQIVRPFADLWLTQWPQLARSGGPEYVGNVL